MNSLHRDGRCLALVLALLLAGADRAHGDEGAQPPPEPAPTLDKLLEDLAKIDPKALADRLAQLQTRDQTLIAEYEALKAKITANEGERASLAVHIGLLKALIQATEVAKPTPKAQAAAPKAPVESPVAEALASATTPAITPASPATMESKPTADPSVPAPPPNATPTPEAAPAMAEAAKPDDPAPAPAEKPTPTRKPASAEAMSPAMAAATATAPEAKITYQDHILPIFSDRCLGCHNPDKAKAGLILDSYDALMQGGGSGEVVVPGSPDDSRLYRLIAHIEEPFMPLKESKLDNAAISRVRRWIAGGALRDANSKIPVVADASPSVQVGIQVDPDAGPMPVNLPEVAEESHVHPVPATAMAVSPEADLLAVGAGGRIRYFDTKTHQFLGALEFPEGEVERLTFSADGTWLGVAGGRPGKSGTVLMYEVETGQRLGPFDRQYDTVRAVAVSPDGFMVAVGGSNSKVRVFDVFDRSKLYEITAHNDWIQAVEFSRDGLWLATADRAGGLFVWESDTGREVYRLPGHPGGITALAFRPDSLTLASTGEDGLVRLWNMEDGRKTKQWRAHSSASLDVTYASDGRLATCGSDGVAKMWDPNGTELRTFPSMGDWVYQVAFTPDAQQIVAGSWTGALAIFEAETGTVLGTLTTSTR